MPEASWRGTIYGGRESTVRAAFLCEFRLQIRYLSPRYSTEETPSDPTEADVPAPAPAAQDNEQPAGPAALVETASAAPVPPAQAAAPTSA